MKLIHKIARRNLIRNRRRTILTSVIIVGTFSLMILFMGLSDGGHKAMIDIGIKMGLGHVIVHSEGYTDDPSLDRLIEQPAMVREQLQTALPDDSKMVSRVRLDALIQAANNGVAITLSGVEPKAEVKVSKIANKDAITQGITLAELPEQRASYELPGIVIGEKLATNLQVAVGDKVTVTVKPKNDSDLSREAFRVSGIFKTGMHEIDAFWAETDISSAQQLAQIGDAATSVAVYLSEDGQLKPVMQQLDQLDAGRPLQFQRWDQAAPELYSAVTMDAAGMYLLMVIVYIVVAVGILNTILISVMKRTREFGVMLALGARPGFVVKVVFWEAIYLSLACLVIGLAIGLAGHYHFATNGLNFREVFGTTLEAGGILLPDKFYANLSVSKVTFSMVFVFALTLIISIYPAIKASKLSPIEATKHD